MLKISKLRNLKITELQNIANSLKINYKGILKPDLIQLILSNQSSNNNKKNNELKNETSEINFSNSKKPIEKEIIQNNEFKPKRKRVIFDKKINKNLKKIKEFFINIRF